MSLGSLTEGRYLVIESGDFALAVSNDNTLVASNATAVKFADPSQQFVIHATDPSQVTAKTFRISAGADLAGNSTMYITSDLGFGPFHQGAVFVITFLGVDAGYTFQEQSRFLSVNHGGEMVSLISAPEGLKLFSVTF